MTQLLIVPVSLSCGVFVSLSLLTIHKHIKSKTQRSATTAAHSGRRNTTIVQYLKRLARSFPDNHNSPEGRKFILSVSFIVSIILLIVTANVVFIVLGGVGSYSGLKLYCSKIDKKRTESFNDQLIEGLGIIKNSVASGQSLMQALDTLVTSTRPPLSDAFADVLRQTRLGTPLAQALDTLSQKNNSRDLRIAVLSLNLAKESGGSMGEILSRLAETMRERKKIQGKIKSLTAQGKASGIVMSCVPFLLLFVLYFMEPDIMGLLFTTLAGNVMLSIVCIMVGFGAFFIDRITKIDF